MALHRNFILNQQPKWTNITSIDNFDLFPTDIINIRERFVFENLPEEIQSDSESDGDSDEDSDSKRKIVSNNRKKYEKKNKLYVLPTILKDSIYTRRKNYKKKLFFI